MSFLFVYFEERHKNTLCAINQILSKSALKTKKINIFSAIWERKRTEFYSHFVVYSYRINANVLQIFFDFSSTNLINTHLCQVVFRLPNSHKELRRSVSASDSTIQISIKHTNTLIIGSNRLKISIKLNGNDIHKLVAHHILISPIRYRICGNASSKPTINL